MNYIYLYRSHAFTTLGALAIIDDSDMKSFHRIRFPCVFVTCLFPTLIIFLLLLIQFILRLESLLRVFYAWFVVLLKVF